MAVRPFSNEPLVDFTKEANAQLMRAAIEKVRGELGREYDLVIGGRRSKTTEKIKSVESRAAVRDRGRASKSRPRARGAGHASGAGGV